MEAATVQALHFQSVEGLVMLLGYKAGNGCFTHG